MTHRVDRRALYLGFAALCGVGGAALPAAAQSYLADNGSSVTVDYSVLGQGAGPGAVSRAPLPMANGSLGGAMPSGTCSCANAPLGVIAAAPRPTFSNPFGARVTQAPAVPPGFMAYSQISGTPSSGGAVVLRAPGTATQQMAATEPTEPMSEEDMTPPPSATTESQAPAASLPATTPTQNAPAAGAPAPSTGSATAATGGETPPDQPETMPNSVPSPVEQPAAQAPAEQPPAAEAPAETAPAPDNTQTAETPPAETPPAEAPPASGEAAQPEQQAAVTPAAPAEGTTPPANGAALPAGAYRILYTGESDDVPASADAELDKIAQDLLANQDKRVQVMAYAAGTEDTESKARRKSLARGLAIRSYLIKAGVPSTRIDVRALGNKAENGPADRVDIVPAS